MKNPCRDLACAVLQQAVDDMRDKRIDRKENRDSALFFLRDQKKGGPVDLWCTFAGINRKAMQKRLARELR